MAQAEHYYSEKPKSETSYGLVIATLRGREYEFLSCSGLFSWREIDRGTRALIDYMQVGASDQVLDLGCGFGAVGIVAANLASSGSALLSDINERACNIARKNLVRSSISNAQARKSNCFAAIPEKFSTVLTNPPFAAGMDTVFRFITESKKHLYPGGTLQLVGRHNKGGSRAEAKILEVFGNCETLGKAGGFRVYKGTNHAETEPGNIPRVVQDAAPERVLRLDKEQA